MAATERLTITLPVDMAGLVRGAVDDGDYAFSSEVIREALRNWKLKRELRLHQLAESSTVQLLAVERTPFTKIVVTLFRPKSTSSPAR
jgi:Arc/MetJ-type ribon-helix-helix transcriptional regulator